jgi:hypothetical protein
VPPAQLQLRQRRKRAAAAAGCAGVRLVANNTPTGVGGAARVKSEAGAPVEGELLHNIIIINPCKPYLSASATTVVT